MKNIKKLLPGVFLLIFMMLGLWLCAQTSNPEIKREGKTFTEVKHKTSDVVLTDYYYNTGGQIYQIFINKTSGRCFINKTSSKTGKQYRYYLPETVSRQICLELGITYKEKK